MTEYGYIPLWVLVNVLSFGKITTFYRLMKDKDKVVVAKNSEFCMTNYINIWIFAVWPVINAHTMRDSLISSLEVVYTITHNNNN